MNTGIFVRPFRRAWTLKQRIIIIFAAQSLITFSSISFISYYAINSILYHKTQTVIESNLKQVELSLENTISNLNHISQQLSAQTTLSEKLDQFLSPGSAFQRAQLIDDLKSDLNTITFTNPNIGLTMYYISGTKEVMFENYSVRSGFDPDKLPLLATYYGISYYGPHRSVDRFNKDYVISALRKVVLSSRDDVYVYIEAAFNLTQNLLDTGQLGKNAVHLLLDNNGRIAYSEVPGVFRAGTNFGDKGKATVGMMDNYYWYKGTSNQGWSVVWMIPKSEYNKEKNLWLTQLFLFSLFVLTVSLLLGLLLWKMVYKPLNSFHKEIKWMKQSDFSFSTAPTNIPEFHRLTVQFREMKAEIGRLFREVELKEKRRADLEIEKILYQINPHFLMNTLDTVHWLAVLNGQGEIDRLIVTLNKLLSYNLRKSGQPATVREELEALNDYLALQQIRYDFKFDVRIRADDSVKDIVIPRFILQPLVENALYHGLTDDGSIHVDVSYDGGVVIVIADNGAGMPEETIRQVLGSGEPEPGQVGLGIGMSYVRRVLTAWYGQRASLEIKSAMGEGTTVSLFLPETEGEEV